MVATLAKMQVVCRALRMFFRNYSFAGDVGESASCAEINGGVWWCERVLEIAGSAGAPAETQVVRGRGELFQ